MNELLATLIASAFSAGGIAGIAALINLGGKHKLHKDLERLAEVGKLSDGDQTAVNSLVASRRAIATEIAAKSLIKHQVGNLLLVLSFLVAYFSLVYVLVFVISGYHLYIDQGELPLGWLALLVVLLAYFYIAISIHAVRLKRRNLQALLIRNEVTADEIVHVATALQRPGGFFRLRKSHDPEILLRNFRNESNRQMRLF